MASNPLPPLFLTGCQSGWHNPFHPRSTPLFLPPPNTPQGWKPALRGRATISTAGSTDVTPYSPQTIAGIHQRLDRALEAELDRLASANPAHQEARSTGQV